MSNVLTPISVIQDMYDISIQLTSPVNDSNGEDLIELGNRTLQLQSDLSEMAKTVESKHARKDEPHTLRSLE